MLTCTNNIAVNGAAGDVTFDIVSTKDTAALASQTGYTIVDKLNMDNCCASYIIGNWCCARKYGIYTWYHNCISKY